MRNLLPSTCVEDERGVLTILDKLPFACKRIFLIEAPAGAKRGGHAHQKTNMIFFLISGKVEVSCITKNTPRKSTLLNRFNRLLSLSPEDYREMMFLEESKLLVLADTHYCYEDYIFEIPND